MAKWPTWEEFREMVAAGKAFFKNDGCTAVPNFNFRHCCEEHDYYYTTHAVSRKEADKRLKKCIKKGGWHLLDNVYYLGVRLFGGLHWNKKFDPNVEIPKEILEIKDGNQEVDRS